MTSIQALTFAIERLTTDRRRFVHVERHDAALVTLIALRELIVDQVQRRGADEPRCGGNIEPSGGAPTFRKVTGLD